ncbi:hypothetical protein [Ignavibacterium album]|uniref:hypothetical protein n=1 Tax=Ignavibacterium album TaxID=591197 RepID=UPI0026F0BFC2|nr:hypothetical protein [Ignavibacterium album]
MDIAAFSFQVERGLIDNVLQVLTVQELGWTDTQYSQVFATANLISETSGMIIGGFLIDNFCKAKMITVNLSLLILPIATMSFLKSFWNSELFVTAFIIGFYILLTFTTIAIFASAMQLCWKRISITQFTLYMAISILGLSAGATLLEPRKVLPNLEYVIPCYIIFAGVMLILIRFINFEKHQKLVKKSERKFFENN